MMDCMKSLFEQMIGVKVTCDYTWNDEGIVRIGAGRDIVAYAASEQVGGLCYAIRRIDKEEYGCCFLF